MTYNPLTASEQEQMSAPDMPRVFVTRKTIWLACSEHGEAIYGWTDEKPDFDNGKIEGGVTMTEDHEYMDCMNYKLSNEEGTAEFAYEDMKRLTEQNAIEILEG